MRKFLHFVKWLTYNALSSFSFMLMMFAFPTCTAFLSNSLVVDIHWVLSVVSKMALGGLLGRDKGFEIATVYSFGEILIMLGVVGPLWGAWNEYSENIWPSLEDKKVTIREFD